MEERPVSVPEMCNDYVNHIEDVFVIALIDEVNKAAENKCGCPQCQKRPNTLGHALAQELDRLTPPPSHIREVVLYERREKRYFNE